MATQTFTGNETQTNRSILLRRTLQLDSVVSLLTGLLLIVDAAPIAAFTGLAWVVALEVVGVGLLGYAALLFLAARRTPIDRRHALGFVTADAAWVIASIVLVLSDWVPLTSAGVWAVLALADVGAIFAVLKYVGLRRAA